MRFSKLLLIFMLIIALAIPQVALAAQTSTPSSSDIKVVNNPSGTADTVTVYNLKAGDIVRVYPNISTTSTIGSGVVPSGEASVTISISQIGAAAGTIYVTIQSGVDSESRRISKSFAAEPATSSLDSAQITVTNNPTGTNDTVYVVNILPGDMIKVYDTPTDPNLIGSGTVAAGQTSITISIPQLGTSAGTVYVSRTTSSQVESKRTAKTYPAEAISPSVVPSDITVTNVSGKNDSLTVKNIQTGDTIKIYQNKNDTTPIGSGVSNGYVVMISIPQLGISKGTIYVTLTRGTMKESEKTAKQYDAESESTSTNNITVVNNENSNDDVILIDNLQPNDIIRVYDGKSVTTPISIGTAVKNLLPPFTEWLLNSTTEIKGSYEFTTNISGTKIFRNNYFVLDVLPNQYYTFSAENVNPNIIVKLSTMDANGGSYKVLSETAYTGAKTVLTPANARKMEVNLYTYTPSGQFNIKNPQLEIGSVATAFEPKPYTEPKNLIPPFTEWDLNTNATVTEPNVLTLNATGADQVTDLINFPVLPNTTYTFSQLTAGKWQVNQYSDLTDSTLTTNNIGLVFIDTALVKTFTTASNAKYLLIRTRNTTSGTFIFANPQLELGSVATTFEPRPIMEVVAEKIVPTKSTVNGEYYINNTHPTAYSPLKRKVERIKEIYKNGHVDTSNWNIITPATDPNAFGYNQARHKNKNTFDPKATYTVTYTTLDTNTLVTARIPINQLGSSDGKVYITIQSPGKLESKRIERSFKAEAPTPKPSLRSIKIKNNTAGTDDTITLYGLSAGDVIKVYSSKIIDEPLGTSTVASGSTIGTVNIPELGPSAGIVYISVTRLGKTESIRVAKSYLAA